MTTNNQITFCLYTFLHKINLMHLISYIYLFSLKWTTEIPVMAAQV